MNFSTTRALAAVWAVIVAVLHGLWASGATTLGLPSGGGRAVELVVGYDVAVAICCLMAGVVALWGSRRMLIIAGVLVAVRGLAGLFFVIQGSLLDTVTVTTAWIQPVFLVGAVLFFIAAGRRRRRRSGLDRHKEVAIDG